MFDPVKFHRNLARTLRADEANVRLAVTKAGGICGPVHRSTRSGGGWSESLSILDGKGNSVDFVCLRAGKGLP